MSASWLVKKSTWCSPSSAAEVDAACGHEAQGTVDLRRDALVPLTLRRRRHELLVPQVHLREVGEAALRERAQQVECRRRLLVCRHQSLGIRPAGVGLERLVVDHVTPERRELHVTDPLGVAERGLANWPAMRPTFTTGTPAA